MIPYGRQTISTEDESAVLEVLRSDFLTQGPVVPRFEAEVARYAGARFGVAVNSATSALHIACLALELGPGDRLWTSPITFVASANCARYCGADVDFVDIDARTYNMCPDALETKLEQAARDGTLPKVLVPVHMCGQSADMVRIRALADRYGIHVVEDASHAIGGEYGGRKIGSCQYSDITVFSFHPVKIVTTAEGGMCMTNDPRLAKRLQLFRSHGITRDPASMETPPEGPWFYEQQELGYNYRLTELQAALGISQLRRIDEWVARRHEIAAAYDDAFAGLPLTTPYQDVSARSAFHLYVPLIEPAANVARAEAFDRLRAAGVGVNVHYIPVHLQPYYRRLGFRPSDFPRAEAYYSRCLSLPMFASLSDADQRHTIDTVRALFA